MFRRKKDDSAGLEVSSTSLIPRISIDGESAVDSKPYIRQQSVLVPTIARQNVPHRRIMDSPGSIRRYHDHQLDPSTGKRLLVGRDIELAGEITACDRLVVEGKVVANLADAGTIEITQTGVFCGSAEVDNADIGGLFDGKLTVRHKLVIRSTGQVHGTVRYARITVELGGEICGVIETLSADTDDEEQVHKLVSSSAIVDPTSGL